MKVPDLNALIADGEWVILLQSGFEDWELEGYDNSFALSRKIEVADELPNLVREHSTEDLNDTDDAYVEPSFRYSPIILRDDLDEDQFEGDNIDSKTPLPVHREQDKEGQGGFSHTLYESSHSSTSSLYSVYSNNTWYSESVTEEEGEGEEEDEEEAEVVMALEPEPESPDIRSMMSPAAVPQSEYEMYEPLDSSYWEENSPTKEDSSPHNNSQQKVNNAPGGSRFHEHLSIDFTTKPLHQIPDISIDIDHSGPYIASTELSHPDFHPPLSPLAPPPLIKDPNGILSPTERPAFGPIPGGKRAKQSTRPRMPVGGTMSSAGGRSSAAAIKPSEPRVQLTMGTGPKEEITTTGTIHKPGARISATVQAGASLAVPCVGMSGKENSRTIPAPLQLPKKHSHSLARALKTARADIHEKGGWGSLLTPGSGPREKNEFSPGMSSGSILTSRRVLDTWKIPLTPVAPLSVASGEVVAVNREIREPINKNDISSPTPARKIIPPKNTQPIEPQAVAAAVAVQRKKSQKETKKSSKARVLKNTAARATVREKGNDYEAQPGEVEILPKELWEVNALVSDTGLPTGKWGECIVRIFKRDNGTFRLVTFRDGLVDEEFIDPSDTELVPEYAHHMHETVPIIFLRKVTEKKAAVDKELLEENGKARRESVRSSFGCVGDGTRRMTTKHIGAETFYYRFRRLDDMFNFQLAWLGELVLTDM